MKYSRISIGGISMFYRECGSSEKPVMLLLHGFPSASHQFRNLMPRLEANFHCIAPDYPGFGQSDAPGRESFTYSFDSLSLYVEKLIDALGIGKFYMYVLDYGAPVGFRIALRRPQSILGIVSQNGNVYEEGLGKKWEKRREYWEHPDEEMRKFFESAFAPETIIGQYTAGEKEGSIAPDGYSLDIYYSKSDGYAERQNDLILDYRSNVALYPEFQKYLREWKPRLLACWGRNDPSFIWAGAEAFLRDDPNARAVPLDGGHFVLESHDREIADLIRGFFAE